MVWFKRERERDERKCEEKRLGGVRIWFEESSKRGFGM